jgi:hypothetical protein
MGQIDLLAIHGMDSSIGERGNTIRPHFVASIPFPCLRLSALQHRQQLAYVHSHPLAVNSSPQPLSPPAFSSIGHFTNKSSGQQEQALA